MDPCIIGELTRGVMLSEESQPQSTPIRVIAFLSHPGCDSILDMENGVKGGAARGKWRDHKRAT